MVADACNVAGYDVGVVGSATQPSRHMFVDNRHYNVRPPATIDKLVNITPITVWFMVRK
jgi:hypothetical protein